MNIKIKILIIAIVSIAIIANVFYIKILKNKVDSVENENSTLLILINDMNRSISTLQKEYDSTITQLYVLQMEKDKTSNEILKIRKEVNKSEDSKDIAPALSNATAYVIERLQSKK